MQQNYYILADVQKRAQFNSNLSFLPLNLKMNKEFEGHN